jgi:hypothetical protein
VFSHATCEKRARDKRLEPMTIGDAGEMYKSTKFLNIEVVSLARIQISSRGSRDNRLSIAPNNVEHFESRGYRY